MIEKLLQQKQAMHNLEENFEKKFKRGLTQFLIMDHLKKINSSKASTIASYIGLNRSAVTGHLDRMELNDLIKRTPIKCDRRVKAITLTKYAKSWYQRNKDKCYEFLNNWV